MAITHVDSPSTHRSQGSDTRYRTQPHRCSSLDVVRVTGGYKYYSELRRTGYYNYSGNTEQKRYDNMGRHAGPLRLHS